jgi:hypothetical protein
MLDDIPCIYEGITFEPNVNVFATFGELYEAINCAKL